MGLLLSLQATALWHVIVLYGVVMTLGANCLGLVVFVPLLSRNFVRNRGMAVSVVQSGERLCPSLLRTGDHDHDIRPWLARRLSLAGRVPGRGDPPAGGVVPWQGSPGVLANVGPEGTGPAVQSGTAQAVRFAGEPGWTPRQAIRTPHFWLLGLVYMFTGLGSFLVALHQLAFAIDIGFDKLYAAGCSAWAPSCRCPA